MRMQRIKGWVVWVKRKWPRQRRGLLLANAFTRWLLFLGYQNNVP